MLQPTALPRLVNHQAEAAIPAWKLASHATRLAMQQRHAMQHPTAMAIAIMMN
jgi:hypothetical protein